MATILGKDYALVDAGDVAGLQSAISAAGANPNSPYNIFLQAGTYNLLATLVIYGKVRIFGRGVDSTIIRQGETDPSKMAGIMTLNASSSELRLHNLTIKDGIANAPQFGAVEGAGIKVHAGLLVVEDCKFENNDANGSGGAIRNVAGQVVTKRTVFTGNNANSGGAIHSSSTLTFALTVEYCRFALNGGGLEGGAILTTANTSNLIWIRNNTFLADNTATNGPHIRNLDYPHPLNAQFNRWLPSPQVIAVDSSNALSTDPTSPMPTSSPEQKMVDELQSYNITAYVNGVSESQTLGKVWTLDELRQVVIGVQYTARAFNLLKYNGASGTDGSAKSLFISVVEAIQFLRVQNGFVISQVDYCNGTNNEACTSNGNAAIIFYGNVVVDQYTVVHELGHRFDNRSDQSVEEDPRDSLSERLGRGGAYGGIIIQDCSEDEERVLGGILDNNQVEQWERGRRGWGSGPGLSNFQIDPLEEAGKTNDEIYEAAADMFLNWVYRRLTDAPPAADPCSAPLTGSWQGFLNIDYRQTPPIEDPYRSGNKRYKYMEETMSTIFDEHPWS